MTNPLKQKREQLGLTQQMVADRLGVTKQLVGYYERNLRFPTSDNLMKVAEVYCLTNEELIDYLKYISKKEGR